MQNSSWTTKSEIEWLDNIGRSSPSTQRTNKIDLLRNYVECSGRHHDWNNIDKFVCIDHAKRLIETFA